MSWEWSHTQEAYDNVRFNIGLIPHDELVVIYAEWKTQNWALGEYEAWKAKAKEIDAKKLADIVYEYSANAATCDNGGHNAYICPDGCHTVPFEREDENDEQ